MRPYMHLNPSRVTLRAKENVILFLTQLFFSLLKSISTGKFYIYLLVLWCSLAYTQDFPVTGNETFKAIVVGDGLAWESNELKITVSVKERSEVGIEIYSPGFDPDDYRAEWQGGIELGDERYDQGKGEVRAEFILSRGNEVITSKSYGVEPHRVDTLFRQTLEAGEYVLTSRFYGKGKNSFIYGFGSGGGVELYLEPYQMIVDPNIMNYNIARGQWQTPFSVRNKTGRLANFWIYDGDGPYELLFKLRSPRGEERDQAVSGDLQWQGYPLEEQGRYDFSFLVPDSAYQYTNTIGIRADCRLRILRGEYGGEYECVTPAIFEVTKTVTPTHVQVGEEITYSINVTNVGSSWGSAYLEDILPKEVEGENLAVNLSLNPQETQTYTIRARVREAVRGEVADVREGHCDGYYSYCVTYSSEKVTGEIVNTAVVSWPEGSASASASIYIVEPTPVAAPPTPPPPPPVFTLTKEASVATACTGDIVGYIIRVSNIGGSAGQVLLEDTLPDSLEGQGLNQNFVLEANGTREFTLSARVRENAPDVIVNRVVLRSTVGDQSAEATIQLDCPAPAAPEPTTMVLIKEAIPSVVRAGDEVSFMLTARNTTNARREFVLEDNLPEGIEGNNFREAFPLEAGESKTFRIDATVASWVAGGTEIINYATLSADGNSVTAEATVQVEAAIITEEVPPPPPPAYVLKKRALRETIEQGEEAVFEIVVNNIGGSAGEVTLRDIMPAGMEGESLTETFVLEAGQNRMFTVKGNVVDCEEITNKATLITDYGEQTATAQVEVSCPPPIPQFEKSRFSDIDVVFASEGEVGLMDTVLVTHLVPEGSEYTANSSRLNGSPIAEPIIDEAGRLYWILGPMTEGKIRYRVKHIVDSLPPVEDPTFTIRTGEQEIMIVGNMSFDNLIALGVDREVTVPRKSLTSDLTIASYQLNVGSRKPIEVGIEFSEAVAEDLVAKGTPYITVGANLEFVVEDSRPSITGYQADLVDGKALLRFEPQPTVTGLELEIGYGNTIKETRLTLVGAQGGFYQYHLHARGRLQGGDLFSDAFAQGYAEIPLAGGRLQAALDIGVNILEFEFENADLDTDRGLKENVNPIDRFHLTGSGTEAQPTLRSDDGIAVRYDTDHFNAGYYAGPLDVPGINGSPSITAARVETNGDIRVAGFAGLVAEGSKQVIFGDPEKNLEDDHLLDGTRSYDLGESVEPSSEELILITIEGKRLLERLRDYTIDYTTGLITLSKPLWSVDETYNPVRLQVTYAPSGTERNDLAYGAGAEYRTDNFRLAAGFINFPSIGLDIGGEVEYQSQNFTLDATYKGRLKDEEDLNSHATLNSRGTFGAFETFTKLTYNDNFDEFKFRGDARIAYRITPVNIIALEQQFGWGHTGLAYERVLGRVVLGGGVGYEWPTATYKALLRGGYWSEAFSFGITHSHPVYTNTNKAVCNKECRNRDKVARTDASFRYQIDDNLSLRALAFYAWGVGVGGTVGLDQRIGDANLSIDYNLPTASGEGNRARFGVDAPLPLSDNLTLDLNAGYEHSFNTDDEDDYVDLTALGAAIRYQNDSLKATLGGEVAIPESGDLKAILRGGITGQLSRDQTISLSGNYQIAPDLKGRADLAYALKSYRLQLLTYHSLISNTDENILKGELAPTYIVSSSFQVRPSVAYRIDFDNDESNAFQFSVGGVYYFDTSFANLGIGVYGHYLLNNGDGNLAASIELMIQLIDNLWLTTGYTFTDNDGITNQTEGGFYFGMDLVGGGQF